jgi:hypothetical protein
MPVGLAGLGLDRGTQDSGALWLFHTLPPSSGRTSTQALSQEGIASRRPRLFFGHRLYRVLSNPHPHRQPVAHHPLPLLPPRPLSAPLRGLWVDPSLEPKEAPGGSLPKWTRQVSRGGLLGGGKATNLPRTLRRAPGAHSRPRSLELVAAPQKPNPPHPPRLARTHSPSAARSLLLSGS